MAHVALIKGGDRFRNVTKALDLIRRDINPDDIDGKQILIKPNLVSDSNPLAVTHVDAVKAVVEFIQQFNSAEIIIAEATAGGSTTKAYRRFGYNRLNGVKLVDVNNDEYETITLITFEGGERQIRISKTILDADYRVSVARAKTHDSVFCTLTLKNMMGSVPHVDHPWVHGTSIERDYPSIPAEEAIKRNYILIKNLVTIIEKVGVNLGVVDGLVGMEGDGPVNGTPIYLGVAAAGVDYVAVDAVMASVMGFDPHTKGDTYLANEKGLGVGDLSRIDVVGEKIANVRMKFKPHSNYQETQTSWMKHHPNYK